jgi:hypothetical protein
VSGRGLGLILVLVLPRIRSAPVLHTSSTEVKSKAENLDLHEIAFNPEEYSIFKTYNIDPRKLTQRCTTS